MAVSVISDFMPFLDFPQDNLGVDGDILADHKKGCVNLIFFQQIENFIRLGRVRSVVECEGDFLRIGLAGYDNAVLEAPSGSRYLWYGQTQNQYNGKDFFHGIPF